MKEVVKTREGLELFINYNPPYAFEQTEISWRGDVYKILSNSSTNGIRTTIVEKV